jgi:hypothetical protein
MNLVIDRPVVFLRRQNAATDHEGVFCYNLGHSLAVPMEVVN